MKSSIKYIILELSNGEQYSIDNEEIIEFDMDIIKDYVDMRPIGYYEKMKFALVNSMLLVIDKYDKQLGLYNKKIFDCENYSVSRIIVITDTNSEIYWVDMSSEDHNDNEINVVKNNKLYISIEDNK